MSSETKGETYPLHVRGMPKLRQTLVSVVSVVFILALLTRLMYAPPAYGLDKSTSTTTSTSVLPMGKPLVIAKGINDNVSPGRITATVESNYSIGSVNEDSIGVNQLSYPAEVAPMKNIGIKFVRVDASLEGSIDSTDVYNCKTGKWSPKLLAPRIRLAQEAGAKPELIIDYSPKCLEQTINGSPPASNYYPPDLGANLIKWENLMSQVGSWAIKNGVRYFEVWNEPDWTFFNGGALRYSQLYSNTVLPLEKQAENLNVKIFVGGPAMADVLGHIDTQFLTTFLGYISTRKLPLNFVSWHTYADDPNTGTASFLLKGLCLTNHLQASGVPCYYTPTMNTQVYANEVADVKSILKRYPMYKPQLWIDEWNLNAESDPRQNTAYASSFLLSAIEKATTAGVNVMEWYNTADYPPGNYQGFGLLNHKLSEKPSYLGYLLWHDMAGKLLKIDLTKSRTNPYQHPGVVASSSVSKAVNILVNNFVSYDVTGNFGTSPTAANILDCKFNVIGLNPNEQYEVTFRTIGLSGQSNFLLSKKELTASKSGKVTVNIQVAEESTTMITIVKVKTGLDSSSMLIFGSTAAVLFFAIIVVLGLKFKSLRKRRNQ